ncbi:MAG: Gfo/Idh/MocA family oxidoreductase [Phycisphaerae bacterium]|nr:Gfo/Idh/MocA family oxidoreductase [Phycisphaerae bacterium]
MSNDSVSVVVIGLGTFGRETLRALYQCSAVQVVGIADRDPQVARHLGQQLDIPFYTDNRQLLLKTKPRAMFLATPPMAAPDLLEACAKSGIHVWKEAPLGRNLGEAAAIYRRFEKARLKLAVGTQRRFADSYMRACELRPRVGKVFLARAHYLFNWGPNLQWRTDRQSAGGGALLELGYHFIDLLSWMLSMPEEVYGTTTCEQPNTNNSDQPPHDTDDTASAILRYKDDSVASIVTSRVSGPVSEELALHGRDGSLIADSESCTLRDPNGDVLDHLATPATPHDIFVRQVESFVRAVRDDDERYPCSAGENLPTHAIIDAIYLSSRTAQPESPMQQLHIHGLEPEECAAHSVTREQ